MGDVNFKYKDVVIDGKKKNISTDLVACRWKAGVYYQGGLRWIRWHAHLLVVEAEQKLKLDVEPLIIVLLYTLLTFKF